MLCLLAIKGQNILNLCIRYSVNFNVGLLLQGYIKILMTVAFGIERGLNQLV